MIFIAKVYSFIKCTNEVYCKYFSKCAVVNKTVTNKICLNFTQEYKL